MDFPDSPEAAAMAFTVFLLTLTHERGETRATSQQALTLLAAVLALVRADPDAWARRH